MCVYIWGTASTLPRFLCCSVYCLFCVALCFVCVCVCKCVLYYFHRVATQLQLTNIYIYIILSDKCHVSLPVASLTILTLQRGGI